MLVPTGAARAPPLQLVNGTGPRETRRPALAALERRHAGDVTVTGEQETRAKWGGAASEG